MEKNVFVDGIKKCSNGSYFQGKWINGNFIGNDKSIYDNYELIGEWKDGNIFEGEKIFKDGGKITNGRWKTI